MRLFIPKMKASPDETFFEELKIYLQNQGINFDESNKILVQVYSDPEGVYGGTIISDEDRAKVFPFYLTRRFKAVQDKYPKVVVWGENGVGE